MDKRLLIYFISIIAIQSFAKDPNWLVNIKTRYQGFEIHGVGYIVEIGNDYFVRTAAHVTMGLCNSEIITGAKEKLKISNKNCITDNAHDDQLIPIKRPKKSQSLGFYSPSIKNFLVWPKLSAEIKNTDRKRFVESGPNAAFYIIPQKLNWWPFDVPFKVLEESYNFGYNPTYRLSNSIRPVKGARSLTADIKVSPGESGSPIIKDMYVGYNISDLEGNLYKYKISNISGGATVILGHVQSYQRYINRSNFTSPKQAEYIYSVYLDNSLINEKIKWRYRKNIFYRIEEKNNTHTKELNITSAKSGNATGANGGNATGANGGNATGANGGNATGANGGVALEDISKKTKSIITPMGMIYKNHEIIVFKVRITKPKRVENYTLYADWENYQYIEEIMHKNNVKLEAVKLTTRNMISLISDKAQHISNYYNTFRRTNSCIIDGKALAKGKLNINIAAFEIISIELNKMTHPIVQTRNKDNGDIYLVDIRGLFSVDVNAYSDQLTESEFSFFNDKSYLVLQTENSKYTHTECVIHSSLSSDIRSKLFKKKTKK